MFSILASHSPIQNQTRALDLYAGTGALGIEALSRGALHVTFVEDKKEALFYLRRNLESLHLNGRATVVDRPVASAYLHPTFQLSFTDMNSTDRVRPGQEFYSHDPNYDPLSQPSFELIFVDPPYALVSRGSVALSLVPYIFQLTVGGCLVLEHSSKDKPPEFDGICMRHTHKYGDTAVSVYFRECDRKVEHSIQR